MCQVPQKIFKESFNDPNVKLPGNFLSTSKSLSLLADDDALVNETNERKPVVPSPIIEPIIHEQRLETAWLQAAEKVTPGLLNRSKSERNQVLPQDEVYNRNQMDFAEPESFTSQHWEDELKDEKMALKIYDVKEATLKSQGSERSDLYPMSPSLLHHSNYASDLSKETM